jgi:hypothetical protein
LSAFFFFGADFLADTAFFAVLFLNAGLRPRVFLGLADFFFLLVLFGMAGVYHRRAESHAIPPTYPVGGDALAKPGDNL